MLTIKHIDRNNTQHLIEAVTVWYEDNGEEIADTGKPWVRKLHYTSGSFVNGGHLTKTLDFGIVYVMNSNGKTVADYDLGDPS